MVARISLVIVPNADNPFFAPRSELVKAFIGEDVYRITFNKATGETVSEGMEFRASGRFLKVWPDKPRFTRVSAVLQLREHIHRQVRNYGETDQAWIEPRWVVLNNPYAVTKLQPSIWGDCPQLIEDGDVMRWTDGASIFS